MTEHIMTYTDYTHDEWVEAQAWAQRIADNAERFPGYRRDNAPLVLAAIAALDLPEPDNDGPGNIVEWHPVARFPESIIWTKPQAGRVYLQQVEPDDLTPDETVELAHALLAAANTARKDTPNA